MELAKAYILAVGSACGLAYGFGRFVAKGPPVIKKFGILIPVAATAAANIRYTMNSIEATTIHLFCPPRQ